MPLVSSGRPSATGAPSVVVDSMQMLFGRHVGWCPLHHYTSPLGNKISRLDVWERGFDELGSPFLLVVHLVEGE